MQVGRYFESSTVSCDGNLEDARICMPSIVLGSYFRFETSLLSILCMLIARMEMGTSRVSGEKKYFYVNYRTFARR